MALDLTNTNKLDQSFSNLVDYVPTLLPQGDRLEDSFGGSARYPAFDEMNNFRNPVVPNYFMAGNEVYESTPYGYYLSANGDYYYSNAEAGQIAKGVGDTAQGIGKVAQASATKDSNKLEIERLAKLRCGKKPKCVFGGKCGDKKKAYQRCISEVQDKYNLEKSQGKESGLDLEKQKIDLEKQKIDLERQRIDTTSRKMEVSDKFLGMPKAIGITVAVVGGLALVVGGIFLVKKLRK
jgi:hypothetical protein